MLNDFIWRVHSRVMFMHGIMHLLVVLFLDHRLGWPCCLPQSTWGECFDLIFINSIFSCIYFCTCMYNLGVLFVVKLCFELEDLYISECCLLNCCFLSPSVFGFCTQRSWALYKLCLRMPLTENTPSNWSTTDSTTSKLWEIWDLGLSIKMHIDMSPNFYICHVCAIKEPDVEKLEKKINCGQIEEVIAQVRRSQSLI